MAVCKKDRAPFSLIRRVFIRFDVRFASHLILCIGLLVCGESAQGEQLLRWKLTPGESLSYQFTQNTQSETSGAGKTMRVAVDCAMTVTWKVESVSDQKVADITQTIDRFSITLKSDKLDPITFDSAAKTPALGPAREIAERVNKLIGASCRIQLTDRGEVTSVKPSERLVQAVSPTEQNAAASQAIGSMLTPDGMSRMLRQTAVILPEKKIAEGAKWEATDELPVAFGKLLQRSQFTYEGLVDSESGKHDKLAVETTFSLEPAAEKGATTTVKEARQTGTLQFDSTAGRFLSSDLVQLLVTERPYRELSIRVQSKSTLSMKLVQ